MMDFYSQVGKLALGSRLRRLSEKLTDDAAKIFALYDVPLDPKWFPVFYVLSQKEEVSITEIAKIIGHSHPSVSKIVKEMKAKGLAIATKSPEDARVNIAKLSDAGKQLRDRLEQQCEDVNLAVNDLLGETQHDLWQAIEEVEFLLGDRSFFDRVRQIRKTRECQGVEIIDYAPEFREHFQQLNREWIDKYFTLEDEDIKALDSLESKILQPGGCILFARYRDKIVGTCALVKLDSETYELAKMAVTEQERGKGIGELLGWKAIAKARELGAKTVFLESNTALKSAIALYQKLGFQKVIGRPSPYQRCNIQMELKLVD